MATIQKLQKSITKQEVGPYQVKTIQDFSQNLRPHIQIGPTSKNKNLSSTAHCNIKTGTWKY